MLHLPTVTLVAIDTAFHTLTEMAVRDTLAHATFGGVLLFSDRDLGVPGHATLPCHATSNAEAQEFMWHGVQPHVRTPHTLYIQWDGWLVRPDLWTDDFLQYDWIGACWDHYHALGVGNGGFSLRSRRLLDVLASERAEFPFLLPEDDAVCRTYRPRLEAQHGLQWPPKPTAKRFSHENGLQPNAETFGFHGLWNWTLHLDEDAFADRVAQIPITLLSHHSVGMLRRQTSDLCKHRHLQILDHRLAAAGLAGRFG